MSMQYWKRWVGALLLRRTKRRTPPGSRLPGRLSPAGETECLAHSVSELPGRSAFVAEGLVSLKTAGYANGRRAAVEALDVLLQDHHNIQMLYESLQELMESNPSEFMLTFARQFMTPAMLEVLPQKPTQTDNDMQNAVAILQEAVSIALRTGNAPAVVSAQRELNLLQGLREGEGDILTSEVLREQLATIQSSIGGNGVSRRMKRDH